MPGVAEAQEIEDEVDDAAVAAAIAAVEQAHRSDKEAPTATGDSAAVPATTSAAEANNGKYMLHRVLCALLPSILTHA